MKTPSGSGPKTPEKKTTKTTTRSEAKPATKATTAKPATKAASKGASPTATKAKAPTSAGADRVRLSVDAVMTPNPTACRPGTDLAEAALTMWSGDFGALPVLDGEGVVVGMITDRDICMALAVSGRRANERNVGEIMAKPVVRCRPEDDARDALAAMAEHRVRRMPVTDEQGHLKGVVSFADLVRTRTPALPEDDVVDALRDVLRPHGEARTKSGAKR